MKPIWTLAAAAGIGIVFGIGIGRSMPGDPPAEGAGAKEQAAGPRTRARDRDRAVPQRSGGAGGEEVLSGILRGRTVEQLTVEDVRNFLDEEREMRKDGDPVAAARRNYQVQLLLSRLPARTLEELATTLLPGTDGSRYGTVVSAWARKDWQAALAWSEGSPENSRWAGSIISVLATTDPIAAEDLVKSRLGGNNGEYNYTGAYSLAMIKARQGGKALLDFLAELPSQQQSSVIFSAMREVPREELASFVEELGRRKLSGEGDWGHSNAFAELMRVDPALANAYLDKMPPGPDRTRLETSALGNLAGAGKADEFAAVLGKSLDGVEEAKRKQHLQNVISQIGHQLGRNPEVIEKFRQAIPPDLRLTADDMRGGGSLLWGDSMGVITRAKLLDDPQEQAKYLATNLDQSTKNLGQSGGGRFNEVDLRILEQRVNSLNLTGAAKEQVDASLSTFREAVRNKKPAAAAE